ETSKQHFLPPLQQELPFYSEYHDHKLNPEHSTNGNVKNIKYITAGKQVSPEAHLSPCTDR
ncbi:5696_t:CDS:2, partial [Funneliformis mosseae]